jgi:hypothetical protein
MVATVVMEIISPIIESISFKNAKGNRTILKKLPKIPNKNKPRDAPKIIKVNPIDGINPREYFERKAWTFGVVTTAKPPPTSNPITLMAVLKIPLLKPIQPNTRKAAAIKMSMKFI